MNAQSYLQSFGWTPGTSLGNPLSHAPSSSTCPSSQRLTKRILTSTKNNTLGVGRKQSNLNHADLWWEKAFDVSLKNLDVNKDTTAIPQQDKNVVDNMNLFAELGGGRGFGGTALAEGGKGGNKKVEDRKAPLYRYFVRGQGLEGTMTSTSTTTTSTTTTTIVQTEVTILGNSRPDKKRKRDIKDNGDETDIPTLLTKAERKAARAKRRELRAMRRALKDERRKVRAGRKAAREELRVQRRAVKEERRRLKAEEKVNRKAKKAESSSLGETGSEKEEDDEKCGQAQSDSGVDMSQDEVSVEGEAVLEKEIKKDTKKKAKEQAKEVGSDIKEKTKKSDKKSKDGSKKKKKKGTGSS